MPHHLFELHSTGLAEIRIHGIDHFATLDKALEMMAVIAFLSSSCGSLSRAALSQAACPQGVTPGSSQCLSTGGSRDQAEPPLRWRITWGAVAEDDEKGYVGTSVGQLTRVAARREAKRKCAMGEVNCKPAHEYKNSYVVVAEPLDAAGKLIAFYQKGEDVDEASNLAISK